MSSARFYQSLYNWQVPCDAVASDDDEDHGRVDVVEAGYLVLDVGHVAGEGEIGDGPRQQDDDNLAQEEEEVHHAVQHDHPHQVPHQQVEGGLGR